MPNCIIAHLPLSEKDILKIIGPNTFTEEPYSENLSDIFQNEEELSTIKESKIIASHSSFVIEADDDIRHQYNDKCVELDN